MALTSLIPTEEIVSGNFDERWSAVPSRRRNPYRLLFPLGLALAWVGLLHWVLHAVGVLPDYRSVFHAIAQIQGFMTCLALGFLMTAIPRRTETAPPSSTELGLALALPTLATFSAWLGYLALSQIFWVVLIVVFVSFVLRRLGGSRAGRRPPNSFVWIPAALAFGLVGSLMTATPGFVPGELFWIHQMGRLLLLQGLLLGLIAGVGGMVLPLITCGDSPPDGRTTGRDRWIRLAHLGAAATLVWSFWIEIQHSARAGLALRAAIMALLLVVGARIWRRPRRPGWHRRLVWIGAWMVPLGYGFAALFVEHKMAGMHIVFIGGFAVMGLSVALHVMLAHGPSPESVYGRPWQLLPFAMLSLLAIVARALVEFDPARFFFWLGVAAGSFLVASLFWFRLARRRIEPVSRAPSG